MLFSCSVRYRANDSNPFFRHPLRSDSHARARSGSEKIPRRSSASLSSRVAENRRSALHRLFLPTSQVASLVHPSSLSGTRCGSYISRALTPCRNSPKPLCQGLLGFRSGCIKRRVLRPVELLRPRGARRGGIWVVRRWSTGRPLLRI
jgi:hypothetical protein